MSLVCAALLAQGFGFESAAHATCSEKVNGHMGWIIANPITTLLFWPPSRTDNFGLFLHVGGLLSDSNFYKPVAEYGVQPGALGTGFPLPNIVPPGQTISDDAIAYVIFNGLVAAGRVPQAGENFVVFLPKGTRSQGGAAGPGHHNWINATFLSDGQTHPIVYSVIEYDANTQTLDLTVSHELYEAYTDPIFTIDSSGKFHGLGWWNESIDSTVTFDSELADLCLSFTYPLPPFVDFDGTWRSQVWSQQACACR
jgi:hypothetical protein